MLGVREPRGLLFNWLEGNYLDTVLVVEDNAEIRDATLSLIENEGLQAVGCADGQIALSYLYDRINELPSLIISDLNMPNLDGPALRNALLAHPQLAEIPFVILDALARTDERCKGLSLACVLPKPLTSESLAELLHKQLAIPRAQVTERPPLRYSQVSEQVVHDLLNEVGVARMHAELASSFAELSPQVKHHLARVEANLTNAINRLRSENPASFAALEGPSKANA